MNSLTSMKIDDGLTEGYVKLWSDVQKRLGERLTDFVQIETDCFGQNNQTE